MIIQILSNGKLTPHPPPHIHIIHITSILHTHHIHITYTSPTQHIHITSHGLSMAQDGNTIPLYDPTHPCYHSIVSVMWCMMYGCDVWCVMCDVWCVMCDVWCVMCDVWCVMYGCDVWCVRMCMDVYRCV